ncbi:MAG: hypothetical protein MR936_09870 [Eubacterium sp.]|nr:hypothetical protein [Eubacterium sp.]
MKSKKKFSFQNIKPIYTIVFFETSQRGFHEFPDTYVHRFKQTSDSGVKLELRQNFLFIPLDIFKTNIQNKNISSKLDAWFAFLCMDEPEWIVRVIEAYLEFEAMYRQIDEMQNEINRMGSELQQSKEELQQKDLKIEELMRRISELEGQTT